MEKNCVHSVGQCQLQALQFSVHLINLLSILLRCNGFTEIQKALVDQRVSNQQQWPWHFFGASLDLGSALELLLSPTTFFFFSFFLFFFQSSCSLLLLYKIHFCLHITIQWKNVLLLLHRVREGDASKLQSFLLLFDLWSAYEAPTYWAFSPFQYDSSAKWPYDVEFFGNFLCSFKRINFNDTIIGHCQLLMSGHCTSHL